jgi:Amidohydrolase family
MNRQPDRSEEPAFKSDEPKRRWSWHPVRVDRIAFPRSAVGLSSLCDNPQQIDLIMQLARLVLLWICGAFLSPVLAWSQAPVPQAPPLPPVPLVLAGGTVVDVADWGRSAKDQQDAVVIVQGGRITDVGSRAAVPIPKGARVIDCTGKFIIPGLVDGFAGMSSQGEADADLYMGVTTVVASSDDRRGHVDLAANPSPHIYLLDSVGTTDDWSLLIGHPGWTEKLRENGHPAELSPEDTLRQLADTAKLGTRVLWLGHNLTAANTQWIIAHAHQLGMVAYGEFVSTPYKVGIEAGVDALLHMSRYELGVVPDELQAPLVEDPEGSAANTAYDYSERLPPNDVHLRAYAHFLAWHHAALMPTFSLSYLRLPGHRNLWKEPAANLLDPARMFSPSDRTTGEMVYPLPAWTRRLPGMTQRWMEANLQKKADQSALRLWRINQTIFAAYPHYLAASGAPVFGTMTGISMHTELEMMVRLGLSAREALAAATNNYAIQFNWTELGSIAPGRRADILVVDADPTVSVWNVRRISTLIVDGNVIDRDGLLNGKK